MEKKKTNNGKEGKRFEEDFKNSINDKMFYHRLKDSASSFNGGQMSRFTLKNPYDATIFYKRALFTLELKSTKATSIAFDRGRKDKKSIKFHQIEGLLDASKYDWIISGLVFDFRATEKREHATYYLSINDFMRFYNESSKKSININDIINYGGIEIEKELKRVRTKYNLTKLTNFLINNYEKEQKERII